MKKYLVFLFLVIISIKSVYSVDLIPGFYLSFIMPFYSGEGFTEGYLNNQKESGYNNLTNNPKLSMGFGTLLEIRFNDFIAIQPEISFTFNGGGIRGSNGEGSDFSQLIDETTLEIPLLLKGIIPIGNDRFYFLAGPALTILLGTPLVKNREGAEFNNDNLDRDNFSVPGFAVEVGFGYDFAFRKGHFFIEGRYSHEFTDSMTAYGDNFNQICVYFNCGYRFGEKK